MTDPAGDRSLGLWIGGGGFWQRLAEKCAGVLQALLLLGLVLLILWPRAVWGEAADGAPLFDLHCAGCHPGGGNIVRRGRGLQEATLRRQGIDGPAAVAVIAANGIGRMDGYASVLGAGGADRVADWVWRQALAGWPRDARPAAVEVPQDADSALSADRGKRP
jgi:cytochrome c6